MPATPSWTVALRALYDRMLADYAAGTRSATVSEKEAAFLSDIGLRPIQVYDFVEDFARGGEPDWETFLLIAARRREYFIFEQKRCWDDRRIATADLPPKPAELAGIPWLPRIICKARHFLRGTLEDEIMYCCGGDRNFLRQQGWHAADFLALVERAGDDDSAILRALQGGFEQFPG